MIRCISQHTWDNVGWMVGQHRREWSHNKETLGQCLVCARIELLHLGGLYIARPSCSSVVYHSTCAITLPTLDTAPSHVRICGWLTSLCPPLSILNIVVSLWLAGCLAKSTLIGWREYYGGGVGRGWCRQTPVWSQASTRNWANTVSIFAHCQRRWTNIETTLG